MKPTDEQVVEWARKAQVANAWDINWFDPYYASFAALAYEAGAAAEREEWKKEFAGMGEWGCVYLLEERGQS